MLSKTELEEVIRGCRRSDRYAQNRLYRAFFAWATAICQRYTGHAEDAGECVQDGFFKVFTKIDKYTGEQSFEAWIKRVMINTCIDRYRHELKRPDTVELTEYHDEAVLPEILVNADENYLLQLIRQLPPAYQITFNLYAVEGYEYREIADILGVSIGSVKSNLSKARLRLKTMLLNLQTKDADAR
ncbi:MAG: RNA polymerase sigma factor [Lewinellaceae bacterium]|nr:RNA polymerase sigma factor [Saprospiraceae bacterium]MCB9356376.1 RNA polymerase sigma factor [Lewinellaceae bacterium]